GRRELGQIPPGPPTRTRGGSSAPVSRAGSAVMTDVLPRLKNVVRNGDGWTARCPAHDDQRNSLSIHHRDGRWLLKCHAGCGFEEIIGALGMSAIDFFDEPGQQGDGGRGGALPPRNTCNRATPAKPSATGLTLAEYATAKALTVDFLKSCGLS